MPINMQMINLIRPKQRNNTSRQGTLLDRSNLYPLMTEYEFELRYAQRTTSVNIADWTAKTGLD